MRHHDSKLADVMMLPMRTTVTLDEDVAAKLKQVARERGVSFKAVLNDVIRAGLSDSALPRKPFKMKTAPLGARFNIDKALTIAGEMEDEEIIRKMELGK
jgi:ribbon-helix-helix CopG family protein